MNNRVFLNLSGTFFLLLMLPLQATALLTIHGEARSLDSNQLLYTEQHVITDNRHDVSYRFPDGTPLAEKIIHYQKGYQTPAFELYDHRFNRQSGSKWESGMWVLWQKNESGDLKEKKFEDKSDLVIDSGFNYFVHQHADELADGKKLEFTFGITDPPMGIDMRIWKVDCKDIALENNEKPHLCFRVVSRNPLLRWFIPDIYLAYVKDAQLAAPLLVLYQGPSNLPDNSGKGQTVRITYRYEFSA